MTKLVAELWLHGLDEWVCHCCWEPCGKGKEPPAHVCVAPTWRLSDERPWMPKSHFSQPIPKVDFRLEGWPAGTWHCTLAGGTGPYVAFTPFHEMEPTPNTRGRGGVRA